MPQRLRQWWALSKGERAALPAMMLALPLLSASLRMFGYARTRRWVERATTCTTTRDATPAERARGERLALLAAIAGRHGPVRTTCLRQSLLVYGLLRRGGLKPELKIGARQTSAVPDMHAWVELDATPLGQNDLNHFAFPASSSKPAALP